jgi:glyoxylase-like metal-dependent hydrolase (beta-lactamase superfamily II)
MSTLRAVDQHLWTAEVALREYDVRGALLLGDGRALVWDTLSHPRDMRPYLALIADVDLVVAYSHADWDHIWGTAGLPHDRTVIVGHRACLERFSADVPVTLDQMQTAEPGPWDDVRLVAPTQVFEDQMLVDLGSLSVQIHHLPGHTPDCCVGFVPGRGLLLAGDTAETPFPVVPEGCPLDEWIAGLERWAADSQVQIVVPAHGAVGGREILQDNIRYLQGLRDGRPIDIPGSLTDFYQRTHESNLRAAGIRR